MRAQSSSTRFLNVDLDVFSRQDVRPLVAALRPAVFALYCEKVRGVYVARFELARQPRSPEAAILRFSALVTRLPRSSRRLWDNARRRELNVGIQSGVRPWVTEYALRPEALAAAARIRATVAFTVYGRLSRSTP